MTDTEESLARSIKDYLIGVSSELDAWTEHVSAVTVNGNLVSLWLDEYASEKQLRASWVKADAQQVLAAFDAQDYERVEAWLPNGASPAVSTELGHLVAAGDEWLLAPGVSITVPTEWRSDSAPTQALEPLALPVGKKFKIYRYVHDYTAFDFVKVEALAGQSSASHSLAPDGTEPAILKRGDSEVLARSWTREAGHSGGTHVTELLLNATDGTPVRITAVYVDLPSGIASAADAERLAIEVLDLLSLEVE